MRHGKISSFSLSMLNRSKQPEYYSDRDECAQLKRTEHRVSRVRRSLLSRRDRRLPGGLCTAFATGSHLSIGESIDGVVAL